MSAFIPDRVILCVMLTFYEQSKMCWGGAVLTRAVETVEKLHSSPCPFPATDDAAAKKALSQKRGKKNPHSTSITRLGANVDTVHADRSQHGLAKMWMCSPMGKAWRIDSSVILHLCTSYRISKWLHRSFPPLKTIWLKKKKNRQPPRQQGSQWSQIP